MLGLPGQGSQFVGGDDLFSHSPVAASLLKTADRVLGPIQGYPISVHLREDPVHALLGRKAPNGKYVIKPDTRVIQPAVVTRSLATAAALREGGSNR